MNIIESEAAVVIEPALPAKAAVIWLHGLGADGHDFLPIVPELELPEEAAVRFIFPHAPVRPVTLNNGMPMRAWYDILGLRRGDTQDEAGVRASAETLVALVDAQIADGIAQDCIVIAGFSQGGAVALHVGVRLKTPLAGVLALSTYLPLESTVVRELRNGGRATPILMCHGQFDNVLPLIRGTTSRDLLRSIGCTVQWHDYAMAHQVCEEEIADIGAFLRLRLGLGAV